MRKHLKVLLRVAAGIALLCIAVLSHNYWPEPSFDSDAMPPVDHVVSSLMLSSTEADLAPQHKGSPLLPLPQNLSLDQRKVDLGGRLFRDPLLSADRTVACSHCHQVSRGGSDNLARSVGIGSQLSKINAPSVLNSAFIFASFWDGRASSLEEQIDGPLTSSIEMGSTWDEVIQRLTLGEDYLINFQRVYRASPTPELVRDAIATYERSLITPNSPFDRYLRGDNEALNANEREGYRLFQINGCVSCHQGVNIGGNMFQRFGVMDNYFEARGNITHEDYGRYNVTGDEEDRFRFKVPSLRNVALTAPYFHDGSVATLQEAVKIMGHYQLGVELGEREIRFIVLFLDTLTGEMPEK